MKPSASKKNQGTGDGTLRAAVVGLVHGSSHVEQIVRRPELQLTALCDLDSELLARVGESTGLPESARYTDYHRMLEDIRPDVVVIATPVKTHADLATTALERNIHVLLEKPMTHDLPSAIALAETASRSRAVLQIGFEFRSAPLTQKTLEIIRSGEIGDVVVVWARMFRGPNRGGWRTRVGAFLDCMIHEIDGMMEFADADFERAVAFGGPQGVRGRKPLDQAPVTVSASVEFENAVRGSIAFSSLNRTYDNTHFGVVGDKGRIDAGTWEPDGAGSLKLLTQGGLFRTKIDIDGTKTTIGHLGFDEQYDFLLATLHSGGANISDAANSVRTQRLMTALEISMCEGRIVGREEL